MTPFVCTVKTIKFDKNLTPVKIRIN